MIPGAGGTPAENSVRRTGKRAPSPRKKHKNPEVIYGTDSKNGGFHTENAFYEDCLRAAWNWAKRSIIDSLGCGACRRG
jgi:hypothetical protein